MIQNDERAALIDTLYNRALVCARNSFAAKDYDGRIVWAGRFEESVFALELLRVRQSRDAKAVKSVSSHEKKKKQ